MNKLILGDNLEILKNMDSESVDLIYLDPPFFSTTAKGKVDLNESARLINKVRPLIKDNGWLVAVNNALYVSGAAYISELEKLCADGYLSIETLIPVPQDFIGEQKSAPISLPPLIGCGCAEIP